MRSRALRFQDETALRKALEVIEDLSARGPVSYDLMGGGNAILVVPEWVYRQMEAPLRDQEIAYSEMVVRPFSDLPPGRQAELRGWRWGNHAARE